MAGLSSSLRGMGFMGGLSVLTKALAILKIAVLARILSPAQFGTYGVALLVLGFLEVLTETGINIFLVQQKDDALDYLDSSWVVSILRGFLIAIVILILTPAIIAFFKSPEVFYLLLLVAGVAVVRGFINPAVVFFQKKLEFSKVFMFRGSLYVIDAIISISLALLTHSESAMVVGMLGAAVVELVISFLIFKEKPRFRLDKEKFKKVLGSGKWITGAGIFSYVSQNFDNVVVGKLLGTTSLGYYQQSYSISTLPVSGVSDVVNKVMFPTFVNIATQKEKLRQAFVKTLFAVFILATVFGLIIFFFSKPLILIFLGASWLTIEPTLKVLAIFGVLKAIVNASYALFLALKLQKVVMASELSGIIGMLIVIYPFVMWYGTIGAAYSAIVAVFCSMPIAIINVKKTFFDK
jgi:O-antigen/teichoic acid export membrane protein